MAVARSTGEPGKASPRRVAGALRSKAAGESRGRLSPLVEHLTKGLGGVRSMWRAERSQGDMQLAVGDADIACRGEQLVQQGSPLLIGASVVSSQQRNQIALGLIGNHLDDIGQVLSFRGELDEGLLAEVLDFNPLGNVATLLEQPRHASTGLCAAACRACHEQS